MSVNSSLARIYGSDYDAVWLAPVGTALPDDLDSTLAVEFQEVGWLDDSGIEESPLGSNSEFRGHQGGGIIRTRMEQGGKEYKFSAIEDKALTRGLWDNVLDTEATTGGHTKETVSPNQRVTAWAAVIDIFDADDATKKERHIIPRFEVRPDGSITYVNSALSVRPMIGTVIGNYEKITGTLTA